MRRMPAVRSVLAWGALLSRIAAGLFGGYALAALASVATLALPIDRVQAVLAGQMGSFLVYAGAVIWVFAARSAGRAWMGLMAAAVLLLPPAWWVWQAGGQS